MHLKALRLFILLLLANSFAGAQNISSSPYTAVGIGDMFYGGNVQQNSMGRISQGLRKPFELNTQNPASYGSLKQTALESAFQYSAGSLSNQSGKSNLENYSFAYLAMGFPISDTLKWGLSFGLLPYSSTGYKVASTQNYPAGGFQATQVLEGRGGLSKFYGGTGIEVFRGLSAGINMAYIFGQLSSTQTLIIPDSFNKYNLQQQRIGYIGGLFFEYGLQYQTRFRDKDSVERYSFVAGATFNLPQGIKGTQDFTARTLGVGRGGGNGKDTIVNEAGSAGTIEMPFGIKVGIAFEDKDFWTVGADFGYNKWEDFRSFGLTDSLRNSMSISLGGSIIPKFNDYKSYLKRIEYRLGARYDNGNLVFGGTPVQIFGVSAGLGLPLGRNKSKMNLSFEYYVKGTHEQGLLREEYFRVMLGVTVSELWFQRYKYD